MSRIVAVAGGRATTVPTYESVEVTRKLATAARPWSDNGTRRQNLMRLATRSTRSCQQAASVAPGPMGTPSTLIALPSPARERRGKGEAAKGQVEAGDAAAAAAAVTAPSSAPGGAARGKKTHSRLLSAFVHLKAGSRREERQAPKHRRQVACAKGKRSIVGKGQNLESRGWRRRRPGATLLGCPARRHSRYRRRGRWWSSTRQLHTLE